MLPLSYPDIACWLIGTLKIYCSFVAMIFYGRTITFLSAGTPDGVQEPEIYKSFRLCKLLRFLERGAKIMLHTNKTANLNTNFRE